jgi:hypothetical protein
MMVLGSVSPETSQPKRPVVKNIVTVREHWHRMSAGNKLTAGLVLLLFLEVLVIVSFDFTISLDIYLTLLLFATLAFLVLLKLVTAFGGHEEDSDPDDWQPQHHSSAASSIRYQTQRRFQLQTGNFAAPAEPAGSGPRMCRDAGLTAIIRLGQHYARTGICHAAQRIGGPYPASQYRSALSKGNPFCMSQSPSMRIFQASAT